MTQSEIVEMKKAVRDRFDKKWRDLPLGPEIAKEGIFQIYYSGFIGAVVWMMNQNKKEETHDLYERSPN